MLNSIVYVLAFAAALSVVAMCLEHLAVIRRQPRRLAWLLAISCSALLPPLMILKSSPEQPAAHAAAEIAPPQPATAIDVANRFTAQEMNSLSSATAAPEALAAVPAGAWTLPAPSRSTLLTAWAVVSGAMLAFLLGSGLQLRRRSTRWQRTVIQEREVLVSEDTGPALLGALRPRIVVPRWFVEEPADTQSLILEHEQQHIAAHDPLLLRVATLMAIAAPWNLPLWWQLHRLRLAIELDCDARVMGSGANAESYGKVLLGVTQRAVAMPVGVVAMSEPVSALETRIRNLAPAPGRHTPLHVIGALLIAAAGVGAAAALEAPAVQSAAKGPSVRAAAPAAPATPVIPATAATPATPARPATEVAAATAPARAPQNSAESSAGTEKTSATQNCTQANGWCAESRTLFTNGSVGQEAMTARSASSAATVGAPPAGYGMGLRDLIALAGKKFQKRFVVDPRTQGTVDLGTLDTNSLTYHAFLEILGVHGFAAVPSGDIVTIIPVASARTVASPVFRADNIQADDAEVVTVLIPVSGDALNISTIVRTLVGQAGQVVAMPDGKTLVVVDKAGNVKRIAAVVEAASKLQ